MNNYEFCANYVSKLAAGKPAAALDYGCGSGHIVSALLKNKINAKGCDIFYAGGDRSKLVPSEMLGTVIFPMDNGVIPFPDESFDYVVNNQVLEHVEDIDRVLFEIHRVLKRGGQVLSLFPDKSVWREGHCGIPFLHWFPKGSKSRVYYAALLRVFGAGYFKGDKPILQWSRDFCEWLDRWTWYRSYREIRAAFDMRFVCLTHIEEIWLRDRLGKGAVLVRWLPKWASRWMVKKMGGLVFICAKSG